MGLSAEVKEIPALLQVQRPQIVFKCAPCEVLGEERHVWLYPGLPWPALGTLRASLGGPGFGVACGHLLGGPL